MKFTIATAPARNSPRMRSPVLAEFAEAVKRLKPGKAVQVTAEQLGWRKGTKALTSRIYHACKAKGIKVCTETQADGSVKVWPQQSEGVGLWERQP